MPSAQRSYLYLYIAGKGKPGNSFAGIGRYEFWVPGLAKDTGKRVIFCSVRIIFVPGTKPKNKNFPRGAFFFSGMGPMPRGGRAIWGATRGYRRANRTLRRPDQPYTAWHGHWFRHCPPAITGASTPLHSAILPPSPQPPLPTQSTEAPHLPSRVLGRNLGSRGALLGLRPAIERTQRAQTNQPTPVA